MSSREPLTATEAMDRARALVPVIAERSAKTEGLRRLPDDTFADLQDAGLLGITQPRRFGGSELTPVEVFDVINLLSQGCGSTGWTYSLLTSHNWGLALFPDQAQREVWEAAPDAMLSTSFSGGPGPEPVDGGLRITEGLWRFNTGVHHADWATLLAPVPQEGTAPDMRFLLVPRNEIEIIEDWRSIGLAGTGSCSVAVKDAFVPHHRTLRLQDVFDHTAPGLAVNEGPLYRLPIVGGWPLFLSTPATGIARGAMAAWIARTKSRVHYITREAVTADPISLTRLGAAGARIEAAERLIRGAAEDMTADILAVGVVSPETEVRSRRDQVFAIKLCVEAVEELFLAAGASTLDESSPIQRHWRDVHAVAQHARNNLDLNLGAWGERALGLSDGLRFFR
jgi:3-hydroxy-9,10-secoandrosta-1,3,5(10)-triene-9,17-dione monooxygenase